MADPLFILPSNSFKRNFKKLTTLVSLLLRVFRSPAGVSYSPSYSGSKSPPNLKQLALEDGRQKIADKVLQRLTRSIDDSPQNHKSINLSEDTRRVLCNPPWNRNVMYLDKARLELQKSSVFQDYPIHIQKALCKVAWYQHLEDGRVIIKTGHKPTIYCIILSGRVTVSHPQTGQIALQDGDTFGEEEFISEERRMRMYLVSGSVELLVISKSDYLDLGLRQAQKSYQKIKPFAFCRSISILKYWPLSDLECQPDVCKIFNSRSNHVIVKDSKKSDWIYIVMTGTCRVVKRFVDTTFRRASLQTHPGEGRKVSVKGGALADSPLLSEQTLSHRRKGLKQSHTTGSLQNTERISNHSKPVPSIPRKQFLVQLDLLQPKDIFGLSAIVHENEPSVALISNGAELVVLSRSFIVHHLTDALKSKLRKLITEYPSEEAMRKKIRDHYMWNTFKQVSFSKRKV